MFPRTFPLRTMPKDSENYICIDFINKLTFSSLSIMLAFASYSSKSRYNMMPVAPFVLPECGV